MTDFRLEMCLFTKTNVTREVEMNIYFELPSHTLCECSEEFMVDLPQKSRAGADIVTSRVDTCDILERLQTLSLLDCSFAVQSLSAGYES